jgi:hypothetical protein
MNEHHYLYGIVAADCPLPSLGQGVDARFPVELARRGQLGALASRVGLDRFDLAKLQAGTTDLPWLSDVAIRHNAILTEAAKCGPLLPLRLGTVFHCRDSLLEKVGHHEDRVAEFLRSLGDRHEWAVKVYLDEDLAQHELLGTGVHAGEPSDQPDRAGAAPGQGALYLQARQQHKARLQQFQVAVRKELLAVERLLQGLADAWRQLQTLPRALLSRRQKMVANGAYLLARSGENAFQAACGDLQQDLAPKGLILETSGPWPAYHFCPTLDAEEEQHAVASLGL